jgi:hypothetical protein
MSIDEKKKLLALHRLQQAEESLQEAQYVKVDVVCEDGLYWLLCRRILKEARGAVNMFLINILMPDFLKVHMIRRDIWYQ